MKKFIVMLMTMSALAFAGADIYDSPLWDDVKRNAYHYADFEFTFGITSQVQIWETGVYGGGLYVVLGRNTNNILYSTNGITWTTNGGTNRASFRSMLYTNSTMWAIATNCDWLMYSTNSGMNWARASVASNADYLRLVYGNGQYIAVQSNYSFINISTNGTSWYTNYAAVPDLSNMTAAAYGTVTSRWSAVGFTNIVWWSANGTNWFTNSIDGTLAWQGLAYGSGKWLAVGMDDGGAKPTNIYAYSTNGSNYVTNSITKACWIDVRYVNGQFVAIASNTNFFAVSTNGTTWSNVVIGATHDWATVVHGTPGLLMIGRTNQFRFSPMGYTYPQMERISAPLSASGVYGVLIKTPYDSSMLVRQKIIVTNANNANRDDALKISVYANVVPLNSWASNYYVVASNFTVRCFGTPYYSNMIGAWGCPDTNAFFLRSMGTKVYLDEKAGVSEETPMAPVQFSNSSWSLIYVSNLTPNVSKMHLDLHIRKP
jgi:hypothetical protein